MRATTFRPCRRAQQPEPNLQIAQVEVIVTTSQDALASVLEPRKFVFIWTAAARREFSAFRSKRGKTDAAVWEPSEMHSHTFFEWGNEKFAAVITIKTLFFSFGRGGAHVCQRRFSASPFFVSSTLCCLKLQFTKLSISCKSPSLSLSFYFDAPDCQSAAIISRLLHLLALFPVSQCLQVTLDVLDVASFVWRKCVKKKSLPTQTNCLHFS